MSQSPATERYVIRAGVPSWLWQIKTNQRICAFRIPKLVGGLQNSLNCGALLRMHTFVEDHD